MAEILKGAPVAKLMESELTARIAALRERGVVPTLAIVRLGSQPEDIYYENSAARLCERVGAEVKHIVYPEDCAESRLIRRIKRISGDDSIHGCLILRPLPPHINEFKVFEALCPEKDLDCLTDGSLGSVFAGKGAGFPPCTAEACIEILQRGGFKLEGKNAVVIGRSLVVGRPAAMMLLQNNCTVTLCHSKTENLAEICRRADIIVSATGHPRTVTADCVRGGQVIIDVGISKGRDSRIEGDVAFEEVSPIVAAITPVPGGIGSVTTATLIKHLADSAEAFAEKTE